MADLPKITSRRHLPTRHEIPCLQIARLGRQFRPFLPQIVGKDVGFGVEMPQLLVLALAALPSIAQRTRDETYLVEPIHDLGRSIGDVFALFYFEVVGIFSDGLVQFLRLCVIGRGEERFPEVGNAEDEVGALKGWVQ